MEERPASERTEVSPTLARAFAACGLLLLAAVPAVRHLPSVDPAPFSAFFADLAADLRRHEGDGGERGGKHGPLFFAADRRLQARMETLERALEDGSWVLALTQGGVQWLLAGWGGAGNEQVYVGRGGWLFYRPGCDYVTGPPFLASDALERRGRAGLSRRAPPVPDPRPAILDFHRRLARRGVRLIVVPAPTKVMVHPEGLAPSWAGRAGAADLHNPSFAALRSQLEAAGVEVYDPAPTLARFRERAFLRTDSHWSPGAVDAVARELAERVRRLGLPFTGPEIAWQRRAADVEGVGDLARALRLPARSALYPPEPARLERVAGPDGRPWQPDPRAQVLLLGDSFTNVFSDPGLGWGRGAGLAEQLAFHLGRGVDRIAVNDDGAAGSRRRLAQELAAGRPRLAQTRLVVWELAVRELAVGDWPTIPLPDEPVADPRQ